MKLMLDTKEYSSKPSGQDAGKLNNRLLKTSVDISVEDLAKALGTGRTFIPAYLKEKGGDIKRRKEYWSSQQIIGLDFDDGMGLKDAIEEFKDTAAFIYTTFSHTDELNKFRVVFALNEPSYDHSEVESLLKYLLVKYPMADSACKDCTRLFYGGTQVFELNYENRISMDDYKENKVSGKTDDSESIHVLPKTCEEPKAKVLVKGVVSRSKSDLKASNIQLIKQKDVEALNGMLKPMCKTVNTKEELLNYLKQQDLREFLGIVGEGSFLNVFHYERNPSASIYKSKCSNGHWLYKCFSPNGNFDSGSIIEVTKKLTGLSNEETLLFLRDVYGIKVVDNEVQMKHRLKIEKYQLLLESDTLKKQAPTFYKVFSISNKVGNIVDLLDLVKRHLPKHKEEKILFNYSIRTIASVFENSTSVTGTKINMFALFSIIRKLEKTEVPEKLLKKQMKSKRKKRTKYINSTYELILPDDEKSFLSEVEKISKQWIENKMTTKAMNYEGILRNFGVVEANRVYPQDKNKEIPSLNENVTSYITRITLEIIYERGWVTEKEILNNVNLSFPGQKGFKEKQLKICLGEMLDGYGLEKIRLNKKLKTQLGIESKGYGYIIRKSIEHKNVKPE